MTIETKVTNHLAKKRPAKFTLSSPIIAELTNSCCEVDQLTRDLRGTGRPMRVYASVLHQMVLAIMALNINLDSQSGDLAQDP